ncbi:uncharacterized protein LOC135713423 [Ochlerotatus camptorhynchus]|uniref:uncharacterized protein LOC135713423 n=1 Tax=Ochlerotatus camptorhynchus TaxID=644619 RepID=UPI0031CDCD0C
MEKLHILTVLVIASASTALALDWYGLTQANYAAIQTGLAQLNDAATRMNQSIIDQQNRIQAALDGVDDFVRQSVFGLMFQYQNLNITMDQITNIGGKIHKAGDYKWYVSYIADDYKRSVTSNVMIPAQSIVQNILNAMTTFYSQQSQSCAQQYAPQLVQARLSVGRLQQCILMATPYFELVANTTTVMFGSGISGAKTILKYLDLCSPNSTTCVTKFFNDVPNLMNNLIISLMNLQGIPESIMSPGVPAVKECVDLISVDIKQVLQGLVNKTNSC